jgi:hypothetical protein
MEESILAYLILTAAMFYGLVLLVLAVIREEEAKRRAGELAWQEWERRA